MPAEMLKSSCWTQWSTNNIWKESQKFFLNICIPKIKKRITVTFISQFLISLIQQKKNFHFSSLTIHANTFLTCLLFWVFFFLVHDSQWFCLNCYFPLSRQTQHHFQIQCWLQNLLMNKKFRLLTIIPTTFASSENV